MYSDEEIRLMTRDWPPEYQGAVIEYARHGRVDLAAKAVGIRRETLSRAIHHGVNGYFTPEDWREVVSKIKWKEIFQEPSTVLQWLQDDVLKKALKGDLTELPDELKVELVKAQLDFIAEIRRQGVAASEGHSRSKVSIETEGSGSVLPEVVQLTKTTLMEAFGKARDEGGKRLEESVREDDGGVRDGTGEAESRGADPSERSD